MQEFTFIITGKNLAEGYLTVDYTPSDSTLSNRIINLYIPNESLESGNVDLIAEAIRRNVIISSPQGSWADEKYRLTTNNIPAELDTFIGRTDLPPVLHTELNTVIVPVDFTDVPTALGQSALPTEQPPRALIKMGADGRAQFLVSDPQSSNNIVNYYFNWNKVVSKLVGQDYWVRFTSDVSPYTGSTDVWHHLNTDQTIGWRDDGDPQSGNYAPVTANVSIQVSSDSNGANIMGSHNMVVNLSYTI